MGSSAARSVHEAATQRCDTKRSVAVQTADSVEHEDSLWDWRTTSTTTATRAVAAVLHSTQILDGTAEAPAVALSGLST